MTTRSSTEIINVDDIKLPPNDSDVFKTWAGAHGHKVVDALKNRGYFAVDLGDLKGNRSMLFKELPDLADKENDQYNLLEATAGGKFTSLVPKGKDHLRKTIQGYAMTVAEELEEKVREMVCKHYNLPKESTGYMFRMMKNRAEVRLVCPDKTNRIEFLAVLNLNEVNSLEVKYNGKGLKFIKFKPSTFLIMAGKPLKDWSEGKIPPLGLQVKMDGGKEKYSVGLFSYCKEQVGSSSGS